MSADETLKSGQLVRYLATTTRWYFALVRHVRAEEIELTGPDAPGSTSKLCNRKRRNSSSARAAVCCTRARLRMATGSFI